MLSDEQIAAMSPSDRRDLMRRLARPVDDIAPATHWLRRTREVRVALLALSAAALVPWTVYLAATLPRAYVAHHWDVAWVGFDALLVVMLAATALAGLLRRQLLVVTAFTTGVLLLCDAWFDVLTADDGDRTWSVVAAVVLELPLAVLLITGSLQLLRLVAARQWAATRGTRSWQVRIPLPDDDPAVRRPAR